ncbi:PAS domain S-box protein [Plasticicumulans sp.]|uniref:PAS domain S-box protein n=1 Tax=Plasticicumulans sp. TaxID=2307179 RepID=UPI00394C14D4
MLSPLFPRLRRLALRLPLIAAAVLVATLTVYALLGAREQAVFYEETVARQNATLARQTASQAALALLRSSRETLERLALDTARDGDVDSVQILDTAGTLLARADATPEGPRLRPSGSAILPPGDGLPHFDWLADTADGQRRAAAWAPVGNAARPLGWVRLEVHMPPAAAIGNWLLTRALPLGLFAAALGALLLAVALRRPLSALNEATDFARELDSRRGEQLDLRCGSIEVSELGEVLNQVSARLAASEAALAASGERLATLLRQAVDGIMTLDAEGRIESFNTTAEHLFGYPARQAIGCHIGLLLPEVRAGETFRHRELQGRRRDGALIPIEVSVGSAHAEGSPQAMYIAIVRDISERRLAEQALGESEARKSAILQAALDAVITIDRRGRVLEFNPAAERLFGFRRGSVLGRDLAELIVPPRLRERHRQGLERYLGTGVSDMLGRRFEVDGLRADGSEIPVEIAVTPIHLEAGTIFTAYLRDISERRAAERALRDSEARYRRVVDSVHEVIFQTDAEGRWTFLNRAWTEITGRNLDESLGRTVSECLDAEDRRSFRAQFALATPDQPQGRSELRLLGRHGEPRWVLMNWELSHGPDGRPLGATGTISDIGERKAAEAELHRAVEAAEAASRAKSEFLATMSHELRTPLNAVIGMTDLALDAVAEAEVRDYLVTARGAAGNLLAIIDDLLDFSKLEAGRLVTRTEPFLLRDTLRTTITNHARAAAGRGLELLWEVDADVPDAVTGDGERLAQIVSHLLSNAVKFTEQGEIVVRVRAQEVSEQSVVLHCSVRDTGIGIAPDKIARIFQPFVQGDTSSTRRFGGTGLGLSISQRLAEMMGGRLWVESSPERGSDFQFTLRLERQPARPDVRRGPEWTGMRALVMAASQSARAVLERQLRYWGFQVAAAGVADEAERLLQERAGFGQHFELALFDETQPGTVELLRRIAPAERRPRVLLLRSPLTPPSASLPAGADASLLKPVDPARLAEALTRALSPAAERTPLVRFGDDTAVTPAPRLDREAIDGRLAPFDPAALLAQCHGNAALAGRLLDLLRRQIPEHLATLRRAVDSEDLVLIRREVRTLAGPLGSVGAQAALSRLRSLEAADAAHAPACFQLLETELQRVLEFAALPLPAEAG